VVHTRALVFHRVRSPQVIAVIPGLPRGISAQVTPSEPATVRCYPVHRPAL